MKISKPNLRRRTITLRQKTLLIIGVTVVGLIAIAFAVSQVIVMSGFAENERRDTAQNVERALGALSDDISDLNALIGTWVPWDETYAFVDDVNNSYVENYLNDNTFANQGTNLMLFLNPSGQIVFGKAFDLQNEQEVPIPESLKENLSESNLLTYHADADSKVSGLLLLPEGPMLIASQPILTSQGEGPIRGALIMGRYLDSAEIGRVAEITHLSLTVQRLDEPQMPPDFKAAHSSLSEKTPIVVRPLDKNSVAGYSLLKDIYGEPVLMLRADLPRVIYQQGQNTVLYFILSLLVVGLVFGVVVVLLLEKSVLSPLSRLSASVSKIGASGDILARVLMTGRDELSSLGGEIDRMLKSLQRSQEALRESELLATATIEQMSDGVMLVGMDGKVTYINKAFERMLGYKMEELVGTSAVELPTYRESKDKKKARQALKMVIEKGSAEPIDMLALTKGGEEIPISFTASMIRDAKGNPKTLVGVIRDVTERRKAEEKLLRSEKYFRSLIENAQDAIVVVGEDVSIVHASPAVERVLGYKPEELVGTDGFSLVNLDDKPLVMKAFAGLGENPDSVGGVELRIRHKDGSWRVVEAVAKNLLSDEAVKGIVVNWRDITERKKAEEALRQSEEKLRIMFEAIVEGVTVTDLQGNMVQVNEAVLRLHGYSRKEEILGRNAFELISPKDHVRAQDNMRKTLEEGQIQAIAYTFLTKDGKEFEAELTAAVLEDKSGNATGLIALTKDITERKRMEEELRRLSDAVRISTDSIVVTDMQGRIIDANEAALRMHGANSKADFIGRDPFAYIQPEDRKKALGNMAKVMETGYLSDIQYHILTNDGRKILIETSISVIKGSSGEPKGLVAVARDITERRRMEEALKHSEEYFRALTENMSDAIVVLDADGILRYESPSVESVLGYKAGERAGMNGLDFVHQDDIQNAAEDLATLIQHPGSFIRKELRAKHNDGSWRAAEITATNLLDNPAVGGIVINFRDITERKKAQEALKQSEKKYRQLFESMQEGLWLIDKDSITTFVNPRMAEILGYTAEEMLGKHLFEFMDERGTEVAKYNLERRRQGIKEQHDFEFTRKDGARVYASLETSPITDEAGNYVGALACVADITERKKAEEEKQRMEEQLRLAGRLAAVGELSAGVAHELNNPLAAIQGYAQFLSSSSNLDVDTKKDVETIYREALRASKITQNLLSFARRHEPEKGFVSLNEVIEKTTELRDHQMKVSNIELVTELAPDLPKTMADFYQLQQVFVNIINNAEQAMVAGHGKGKLVIKTQKFNGMIQVTFTDDGPGISEENMKRIFDPFFTTKEVGKGTGLGLPICYGIVEAHGGRIYAQSKLGTGATFVVEIPIVSEGQ